MNRFQINVAIAGQGHYCRIELPETLEDQALRKAREIQKIFGAAYEVTMTRWNDVGTQMKL